MAAPRFKSEVFVPIRQDSQTFEERQKDIWSDMHERMERRRKEWENEVESMRRDFFKLKPEEKRRGSIENLMDTRPLNNMFYDDVKGQGGKRFHVSFDVNQFKPDEISVRTQEQKLMVHAKHEDNDGPSKVSREFSREVDVPQNVDPQKLQCTLSHDGVLTVEAPVPAPMYDRIRESARAPNAHASQARHTSSAQARGGFQSGPTLTEEDGSKVYKITVDVGNEFTPQDLTVKTVDRKLTVHARHEVKLPGRTSYKEFSREFDLPDNVNPDLVTAAMTDDGKLLIEAPVSSYTTGSYTGRPGSTKQPTVTISFEKK